MPTLACVMLKMFVIASSQRVKRRGNSLSVSASPIRSSLVQVFLAPGNGDEYLLKLASRA
jgi:hypothetical protein